jgi:cytidylate kinase
LHPADLDRSDLRGPAADAAAAAVASIAGVRKALLAFQHDFATQRGAVLDGRDIGTVIFPDASAKLFITASLAERARRRWLELRNKSIDAERAVVEADMQLRDETDMARAAAPLRAAEDALLLDTTDMDAETAFQTALAFIRKKISVQ